MRGLDSSAVHEKRARRHYGCDYQGDLPVIGADDEINNHTYWCSKNDCMRVREKMEWFMRKVIGRNCRRLNQLTSAQEEIIGDNFSMTHEFHRTLPKANFTTHDLIFWDDLLVKLPQPQLSESHLTEARLATPTMLRITAGEVCYPRRLYSSHKLANNPQQMSTKSALSAAIFPRFTFPSWPPSVTAAATRFTKSRTSLGSLSSERFSSFSFSSRGSSVVSPPRSSSDPRPALPKRSIRLGNRSLPGSCSTFSPISLCCLFGSGCVYDWCLRSGWLHGSLSLSIIGLHLESRLLISSSLRGFSVLRDDLLMGMLSSWVGNQ